MTRRSPRADVRPIAAGPETGLRVTVTIRHAEGSAATELHERQLRALVRLLKRAAALQAEARRAA
jgi:hypothetical protein